MYKNNQLWNRYFLRSQKISYRYKETPRCLSIYIIDLNQFLLLFLLTITKQKYFSFSPKLLFNYIVFEFILLLVVQPRYFKNYIATISCTWEWASIPHDHHQIFIKTPWLVHQDPINMYVWIVLKSIPKIVIIANYVSKATSYRTAVIEAKGL